MSEPKNPKPLPAGNEWEDDSEPWRHPPVAPHDAGVAESLGKAVSNVVTGPLEGDPAKADKAMPKPVGKP